MFAEGLDLPLEQELAMELLTYKVDKEVMMMVSKVHYISREERMEKELADALARSFARLMPNKVYLEKQYEVPSRNTGWPKAVAKLCGGAPSPNKEQDRILAMMEQYSEQAESCGSSDESSDEEQPQAKLLKLDVKLKNIHGVPVPQDKGASSTTSTPLMMATASSVQSVTLPLLDLQDQLSAEFLVRYLHQLHPSLQEDLLQKDCRYYFLQLLQPCLGGSQAQATIPSPPAIRPAKVKKRVNYTEEKEPGTEDLADSDGSDEFTPRP